MYASVKSYVVQGATVAHSVQQRWAVLQHLFLPHLCNCTSMWLNILW